MEDAPPDAPDGVTFTVRLLVNAQRDLADIDAYYAEQALHETERCLDAIEAALDWIAEYAHQPAVGRYGLRHVSTATFRYYVWYRLFEAEQFAQVVAVLHHSRGGRCPRQPDALSPPLTSANQAGCVR